MPLSGQTALTTIAAVKGLQIAYPPVTLAEIGPFPDGTYLYLAPENFDANDGGFQYNGHSYVPRIVEQSLGEISSVSDNGIVQSPQITLKLADADKELYNQYERAYGLKGVKIKLRVVFVDYGSRTFSSDSQIRFVGVCNAPDADDEFLTVLCTNILNLSRTFLPTNAISRQCPYPFPTNHAQRVSAALDVDSDFYPCGYSPDVTDADGAGGSAAARGNHSSGGTNPDGTPASDGAGCFTYCDGTWDSCIARLGNIGLPKSNNNAAQPVQIEQDQAGRRTGRFGGIRWDPPQTWGGNAYISGNYTQGINNANQAKYRDFVPLVYGTTFVQPPVMVMIGNPNSTKFEVVLCHGQIHTDLGTEGPIQTVIVNDFVVPYVKGPNFKDKLLWWGWINNGSRDGTCNRDLGFDGRGDPYGSMAAIEIQVPIQVASSDSIPNVQVLLSGPPINCPTDASGDPAAMTKLQTGNAANVTMDMLTWCGLSANQQKNDFDLASVYNASRYCDVPVTYTNLLGQVVTHPRFTVGFALRARQAASEIIKNLLAAWRGIIMPNTRLGAGDTAGKLQLLFKGTTADQQPNSTPIVGANDFTLLDSATADGTTSGASPAYHFDETNMARKAGRDSPSTLKITQRKMSDTPNILGITFQDEDYFWNNDSINVIDSTDIARTGQQVNSSEAAMGIVNYDQGRRIIQSQFAEQYRGNERSGVNGLNDSGGTLIAEFETSFQALHLCVNDIITLSSTKYALDHQTFRIFSIGATANFERLIIKAQWHEDDWYLDTYGQNPAPLLQAQRLQRLLRPPFGWLPDQEAPVAGNGLYAPTAKSFSLAMAYQTAADGTAIALLVVTGHLPVNDFSQKTSPPYAPQATTDTPDTGQPGLSAGTYYMAVCAEDEDSKLTAPSWPIAKVIVVGTEAIELPNIYYHDGTSKVKVYASDNPNNLTLQSEISGTPSSIKLNSLKVSDEALPDVMFDHLVFRTKKVYHSGVFGAVVSQIVDGTHIKLDVAGFSTNQFANYVLSVLGRTKSTDPLPIWDFKIASNSSDTFVIGAGVDGHTPDVTNLGTDSNGNTLKLEVGDAVVMRAYGNIVNHNSIGDANFVNAVDYFDPPITILDASNASPIVLTLNTGWDGYDGAKCYVTGVKGNTAANGIFIASFDPTKPSQVTLAHRVDDDGTTESGPTAGNGDYESGGTIQLITNGLKPHEESGRYVRLRTGTGAGQVRKIIDNSQTELQIDGDWVVMPDATTTFIIEDAGWLDAVTTSPTHNADPTTEISATFTVDNWLEQVLLVGAFSARADNTECVPTDAPYREVYLEGGDGNAVVQFDKATFNIATVNDAMVATDVTSHYIVLRPGTLGSLTVQAKIPPTGSPMIIDIRQTAADGSYSRSIFIDGPTGNLDVNRIHIPEGSTDLITIDIASTVINGGNLRFNFNDILTIDLLAVGSVQPGSNIVLVAKWAVD